MTDKLIFLVTFVAAERAVPLVDPSMTSLTLLGLGAGPEGLGAVPAAVLPLPGMSGHVKLIPGVAFEPLPAILTEIFLHVFLKMLMFDVNRKLFDHHSTNVTGLLCSLVTPSHVLLQVCLSVVNFTTNLTEAGAASVIILLRLRGSSSLWFVGDSQTFFMLLGIL